MSAQATPDLPEDPVPGRLLRLDASCPRCGSRPAVRVAPDVVQALAAHAPQARLATYQCQRRRCGAIFDLTARAFQDAS
jgi:DNA-directed RNA polymerase subunit RPC12/RpoP